MTVEPSPGSHVLSHIAELEQHRGRRATRRGQCVAEIDGAVLSVLADSGGRQTPAEIATKVGMSEDAVRSIVSMLAEQGKVRIAAVELPPHAAWGGAA